MLNKNTINVLQSLNTITNSAILKYPTTVLNNPAGDVVVKLNLSTLDADAFQDIGIFNLSEFISTFKLFDEYDCSISDGVISISSDNNSLQYLTTSVNVLENFNKDENLFSSTAAVPSVAKFSLTPEDVKTIKSASGVFKDLEDIIIESKDKDITIKLGSTNNFNAKSNSFSIRKPGQDATKEFVLKIPAENFNSLPVSDYTFEVKYNEQRDAYRVLLTSNEADVQVLLAIKK